MQQTDNDLMLEVCKGNHDAFAALVMRHTQTFHALAYRTLRNQDDAQDIVQNSFVKLWNKPQAWQADKSKFTTWFYRVIINACHDHRRKHSRLVNVDDSVFEQASPSVESEQNAFEHRQSENWQQAALEMAIADLPSSQRDALNLVVYSELPQKQVAEILGISLKAVESLLIRAKRSIAKHINKIEKQVSDKASNTNEQTESASQRLNLKVLT